MGYTFISGAGTKTIRSAPWCRRGELHIDRKEPLFSPVGREVVHP